MAIIETEIDSRGAATVWLNRPEVHNAFDDTLIAMLTAELKRLESDQKVRVAVLAGRGKSFSAGADLNWMKRMATYSESQNRRDAEGLAELLRTLNFLKKPTIAAVHGNAYAGGVGLVACCDIVFAVEKANFALTETRLGLIPATIGPYVLAAIGERAARRYFLSAEAFTAHEAHRIGLVHEICKADQLPVLVSQMVDTLVACGPAAMRQAKELIWRVGRGVIDADMIAETARRIAEIRVSPEGREGIASFLEKRKPKWRG
jgi:methylglutaconyl-CoA hydratase